MVDKLQIEAKRKFSKSQEKMNTTETFPMRLSPLKNMDHPFFPVSTSSFSSESEASDGRKRKLSSTQTIIDLQLTNPLPPDWEQCLDLQSGRMYYLNRKTLKKSWGKPKERKVDLDLNISHQYWDTESIEDSSPTPEETKKQRICGNSGGGMVTLVCINCHLLVMMLRSSPLCPNCKHMHLLLPLPAPVNTGTIKSLETLTLLR